MGRAARLAPERGGESVVSHVVDRVALAGLGVAEAVGHRARGGCAYRFLGTTPLDTMNTRPEWLPLTPLQPEVITKSS